MHAQISWRELGSPSEPGTYRWRGIAVQVRQRDIDLANSATEQSEAVIFNATLFEPISGERRYVLANLA